jgi:hypothetical protein
MKAEPEFADAFGPWKVLEELSDPLVSGECERLQTGEIGGGNRSTSTTASDR